MKVRLSLLLLLGTLSALAEDKSLRVLDPSLMDTTVDPCVDFYQYSCGAWLKQNPIPADESTYSRSDEVVEENRLVLKAILDKAAAGGVERSPNEQKIGDYYAGCMNTGAIDQAGTKPLQPLLNRIAALKSKEEFPEIAAYLDSIGVSTFFSFASEQDFKDATQEIAMFDQANLGLPEKGYYLRQDTDTVKLRSQYREHVAQTFVLLGETPKQSARDADMVLRLETALAGSSLSVVERRDPASLYHKMSLAQLDHSTPLFSFDRFLRAAQVPALESLNVTVPGYFATMNQLIATTSLKDWQTYLRWALMHHLPAIALPQALDQESFHFYDSLLSGQPEQKVRWKRCVAAVDDVLGEALGQVYVAQRFSPADKQRTLELTHDVEAAMGREIGQLDWMSPATKVRAQDKLHAVANQVGYPDKWRDYSRFEVVRGEALGNALRAAAFEEKHDLAKIGKPVDRGEWSMSPPTVNAYYNPQLNDINFPAGILQPPFYDSRQDDAVNYGDIGGTIGHELTHGFDDEGRQFDANGNLEDWWLAADSKQFKERADCVVNEFDGFVGVDTLHVNGKLTLGENLADLGGLKLAFLAYLDRAQKQGIDVRDKGTPEYGGLTLEQQFFVAYGQGWCSNDRPESLKVLLQSDAHAPEVFRTNGVVLNLTEFQRAFACKTGQPMAPVKRCAVW